MVNKNFGNTSANAVQMEVTHVAPHHQMTNRLDIIDDHNEPMSVLVSEWVGIQLRDRLIERFGEKDVHFKMMELANVTSNSVIFYNADEIADGQIKAVFKVIDKTVTNVKAIPIKGAVGDDILQIVDEDQMKAAGWVRRDKGEKL